MSNSLKIKGLAPNYDYDKLTKAVELFGPCKIVIDSFEAIVTYLSEESLLRAVPSLNNTDLFGANSSNVEVFSQNPKLQKWSFFNTKLKSDKPKNVEASGKTSPNFGGNTSIHKSYGNENINPNGFKSVVQYQNTSQGLNIQSKSSMNIEEPKYLETKMQMNKQLDLEYLNCPINLSKKIINLMESFSTKKDTEPLLQIYNNTEQFIQENNNFDPNSSIIKEIDPIIIENQKLLEEDLNALSYSQLQELLIKRNISPNGPKQYLVYLLEQSLYN